MTHVISMGKKNSRRREFTKNAKTVANTATKNAAKTIAPRIKTAHELAKNAKTVAQRPNL